ncbi:MAG: hypothetical protein KC421_19785 [Anaerolineales bacterium]|nr:hypothetical protein [Anaerolineales bacterium]
MAEGSKTFINNTDKDVNITLFVRAGDNPQDEGGTELVSVAKHGGHVEMIFEGDAGSLGYVYLNGLLIEWQDGSDMIGVSRKVVTRGDAWDNVMNTNNTVVISSLAGGVFNASGANT